jgi:hypothetical protein
MKTQLRFLAAGALAASLFAGCGTTDNNGNNETPDAGHIDNKPDSGTPEPTCFENPTSNHEIVNSCPPPGVIQITKNPVLPLNADGTLPALP